MIIQRFDTVTSKAKKVSFGEVAKGFQDTFSHIEITHKLLNNKTLKNGRFEFRRKLN